jgi:hypothetical protein
LKIPEDIDFIYSIDFSDFGDHSTLPTFQALKIANDIACIGFSGFGDN